MYPEKNEIITTVILAAILFVLLVFVVIWASIKYYNARQERRQLHLSFQKELLKTQLETQEETFYQIGEELHDNIGQLLSSTRMLLGITARAMKEVPDTFHTAEQTLAKAIQDLRMLSKSLNKEWLHQFNLLDNLQVEVQRINASRTIEISLESTEKRLMLSPESQVMLFRIIQEALQNSIKHAEPKKIHISIQQYSQIQVKIKDDGIGIKIDKTQRTGVGLLNMNHRTNLLGGSIAWHSLPSEGTEVSIEIPIQNHDI